MKLASVKYWTSILFISWVFMIQANESLFENANQRYEEKKYAEAIDAYQMLIDSGYQSFNLHYNLGNAYFRTNLLGKSILHYEKALKLNPGNKDALHNLSIARSNTKDKIDVLPDLFFVTWWKQLLALNDAKSWGRWLIAFVWIVCLLIGANWFVKKDYIRTIIRWLLGVCLFLLLWLGIFTYAQHQRETQQTFAIITAEQVAIRSAPDEDANLVLYLHEGTKVKLIDATSGWQKVQLSSEKIGWLKQGNFETI